jgi:hypothetical protein
MFFTAICNDDPTTCHQPIQAVASGENVTCFCQKKGGCTVGGATCAGPEKALARQEKIDDASKTSISTNPDHDSETVIVIKPVHTPETAFATKLEHEGSVNNCGSVRGANIDWTGRESVKYDPMMDEQMCCDLCKDEKDCGGWVFNNDGYCYQKYITAGF